MHRPLCGGPSGLSCSGVKLVTCVLPRRIGQAVHFIAILVAPCRPTFVLNKPGTMLLARHAGGRVPLHVSRSEIGYS